MTTPAAASAGGPAAGTPIRDRILGAAAQCFRRFGVAKTTLEDIADEAGTSRATIYRTIPGGRDEIVLAVLLAESWANLEPIRTELEDLPSFEAQLVEGLARVVEMSREDPQLALLFTAETVMTSVVLPGAWDAVLLATAEFIGPITERARARGELRTDLADTQISDWLCRVIVSIMAFPGEFVDVPDQLRNYLRNFLVPSLVASNPGGPIARPRTPEKENTG